jgi:hypothetical protein
MLSEARLREGLCLPPDQMLSPLQGMAEGMLGDPKLEVADVASATLSGMLKVAPDSTAAATRARFLDAASVASTSRRKARRRGASSAGGAVLHPEGYRIVLLHIYHSLWRRSGYDSLGGCNWIQVAPATVAAMCRTLVRLTFRPTG